MKTGYENVEVAKEFAMPYIMLRNPKPYDTTTLNYEWQVWGTQAFSIQMCIRDRPDIDGGLVGGASLKPDFGKIVNYKEI